MDKSVEKQNSTRPCDVRKASGGPGDKPTWNSGAKTLVGTAASSRSRIWYTVGLGTLNEIYFPDVDQANTRSVRFLVTDGGTYFSDEAWDADHTVTWEAGIPCCRIESKCKQQRYTIVKEIITDPVRDTLMVRVRFTPRDTGDLKLYLYIDPHIGDKGEGNTAWIGAYKGREMLFAQRGQMALAAALTVPTLQTSCGYVGTSDGYILLSKHKELPDSNLAEKGNVALTAEIDYHAAGDGPFVLAIACGSSAAEAAQQASAGILQYFDKTQRLFVQLWREQQELYADIRDLSGQPIDMYRVSTAVLETHQSKRFPGGFVASLSLPWGFARSDKDIGGYHVLWPRDMVETAMGKLASGDARSARSTLFYLRCTQEQSGGWSQNMWLDGTPHWGAIQMDGIALPILLVDQLRRENALDGYNAKPMVDEAVRFLLKHGPYTQQGRWEALGGYSPYTTATEVAALLAAADYCDEAGDAEGSAFLRDTADAWHDTVDEFTYVTGTPLAHKCGVSGYYVRMAPQARVEKDSMGTLRNVMPNLRLGHKHQLAADIVSPDAIALVRFGLRAANDERVVNTVKVLDATLMRETKTGPVWIRSTKDGYGEHADGKPFKKHGIGRGWPLLAGERGHYEIAAGNHDYALELLKTMARQTSECGMIPEQVWDAPDIPEHMLYNGHPAGSGMPLVWAHAEYIKLLRSLHDGKIWDLPPQTVKRYQEEKRTASFQIWTPQQKRGYMQVGKDLRVDLPSAATVEWKTGKQAGTVRTQDAGYALHCAVVPCASADAEDEVQVRIVPDSTADHEELKEQSFTIKRVSALE